MNGWSRKGAILFDSFRAQQIGIKAFNKNCRIAQNIQIGKIEYGKVLEGLGFRL